MESTVSQLVESPKRETTICTLSKSSSEGAAISTTSGSDVAESHSGFGQRAFGVVAESSGFNSPLPFQNCTTLLAAPWKISKFVSKKSEFAGDLKA